MDNVFFRKRLLRCQTQYDMMEKLLNSGRTPHAILIEGGQGGGKKTFALHLAMAIICRENGMPCFSCSSCKKASNYNHPDITFVLGNEKTGSISVDDIRELRKDAYKIPHESEKRIFIIPNAENLTIGAENAFLKILEEPPKTAVFILTAPNCEQLLETVRSRVIIISLPIIPTSLRVEALNELFDFSKQEEFKEISAAMATVGQCVSIMTDKSLRSVFDDSVKLNSFLEKKNKYGILALLSNYGGSSQRRLLKILLAMTASVMTARVRNQAQLHRASDIKRNLDAIEKAGVFLDNNVGSSVVSAFLAGELCI